MWSITSKCFAISNLLQVPDPFFVLSVVGPLLGGVFTDHVSWRCSYLPTSETLISLHLLLGVSGLICARESSLAFALFPIDVVDPLEASPVSYSSESLSQPEFASRNVTAGTLETIRFSRPGLAHLWYCLCIDWSEQR